jgi:hypothetical protein
MWVALIILLVGIMGVGLYVATRPSTNGGSLTATLTADPVNIEKGQSVTLHWSSQNATDLDLEPGVGKVQAEGSTTVTPLESITYTLTASGPGGSDNPTAHVNVTASVTPPVNPPKEDVNPPKVDVNPPQENKGDVTPKVRPQKPPREPKTPPVVVQPPPGPDPKRVKSSITLGDFHLGRGEYDDAIANYQKGLELDPSNGVLQQKLDGAIKACKKENAILNEGLSCGSR